MYVSFVLDGNMNSYDHLRKSLLVLGRGVFKSGSIIDEQKIEEIHFYIM